MDTPKSSVLIGFSTINPVFWATPMTMETLISGAHITMSIRHVAVRNSLYAIGLCLDTPLGTEIPYPAAKLSFTLRLSFLIMAVLFFCFMLFS